MAHHVLEMPISAEQARELRISDTVTLEKTLFGIRDATLIHMFDHGRRTRFDLQGHAVIHTAPNVHRVEKSEIAPAGYEPFCIGTTTSQLMEREGVRIIIGKGGMAQGTLDAFAELGGAYLAIVGGAAALETTWIEAIEDVDMDDLHPESLWRFRIRNFGPLLVGMDSHGGSMFADVRADVASRRNAVLEKLGIAE
jgi:L(+)-tartrate dehydratase beta subunit